MKELANTSMVECYNHQYLWNNRIIKIVYDAILDIWGIEKLWVSIDRANLNFTILPGFEYKAFIHWDYDLVKKPVNFRGVLALSDQTDEHVVGFQFVPELYRNFDSWKKTQFKDRNRLITDITNFEPSIVKIETGDLIIFNSCLPHCIRSNRSEKVQIAQYIAMLPAEEGSERLKNWRIDSWKNRIAPEG